MKTLTRLIHTLTLFFITTGMAHAQTIHVVNNTPGAPDGSNVYTTVDDAITAASDGDIIHIIPSQESYGSFTINKQLQIYGIGINPDKQAPILSRTGSIEIDNNANGTTIEGLWLNGITIVSDVEVSNLTIRNNRFSNRITQFSGSTINGLIIHNNLFEYDNINVTDIGLNTLNGTSNVVITNNIFTGNSSGISGGNQILISHNLFLGNTASRQSFGNLRNAQVNNNIFFGISPSGSTIEYTSFQNNLVFEGTEFPIGENNNTGSGNLEDTDPQFVDLATTASSWDFTWDPTLQAGSPAIGAGTDGSDLGIFGGSASFDLTGVPRPLIQTLNLPAMIGTDQDLDVTIRARGN